MNRCPTCRAYLPDNYTPDMACCLCLRYGPPAVRQHVDLGEDIKKPGAGRYSETLEPGISVVGDWKETEKTEEEKQ